MRKPVTKVLLSLPLYINMKFLVSNTPLPLHLNLFDSCSISFVFSQFRFNLF